MTEEELVSTAKTAKRDYGSKYLVNRNTVSIVDTIFDNLVEIQKKRGFKTKGELFQYFIELDKITNPEIETIHKCKKCDETLAVLKDMNLDRLVHKDLCRQSSCNGSIVTKQKIVKTERYGTTTANDIQSGQTEQKIKPLDSWVQEDGALIEKWTEDLYTKNGEEVVTFVGISNDKKERVATTQKELNLL
jgi:hypothetical protein